MNIPELVFVSRTAWAEGKLHAKGVHTEFRHSYDLIECEEWSAWIIGTAPIRVQCSRRVVHCTGESDPIGAEAVYREEEFFRDLESKERLCLRAAQSVDRFIIQGVPGSTMRPPFFIAAQPSGVPCRARVTIRLLAANLSDFPDVRAAIILEERRNCGFPYMDLLYQNMQRVANNMALPLSCLFPMHLEMESRQVRGTFRLDGMAETNCFLATLFLSDRISELPAGTELCRHVRIPHGDGEAILRSLAIVEETHSIADLIN